MRKIKAYYFFWMLVVSLPACDGPVNSGARDGYVNFNDIKSYILNKMESTRTPSLSVAVAQDGEIVWEESFGYSNREEKIEATPQTIYSLASISKPMTATAIMVLVERGLIDLNEPINNYLGESRLKIYEGNPDDATIARLLHHTAGLPTIWNFYFEGGSDIRPSLPGSIEKYGIITAPPGSHYEYSNLGYGIAGYIVERVSGKPFDQFMKSEVFEPLGMNKSFVISNSHQYKEIAPRYLENKNQSPFYDLISHGGGGMCASVHDLLLFGMFHLKDHLAGQTQILGDSSIEYMQSAVDPGISDSHYKLGWSVNEMHGYRVVNHGGAMPGVSSALMLIPSENIAIAILCNGSYLNLENIAKRIIRQLLPEIGNYKNRTDKKMPDDGKLSAGFVGHWEGAISLPDDQLPIKLLIEKSGSVKVFMMNKKTACDVVNPFTMKNGVLTGSIDFTLPAEDAMSCRHKVVMQLRMVENRLFGYAAAESYRVEVFYLTYHISLTKL